MQKKRFHFSFNAIMYQDMFEYFLKNISKSTCFHRSPCFVESCYLLSSTHNHYCDVILDTMTSQIISLTIVYVTVYSDGDQRKHESSASPAFVRVIHRGPVNSPHKWPVTRKMFPFDDVIMVTEYDKVSIITQLPCRWEVPEHLRSH